MSNYDCPLVPSPNDPTELLSPEDWEVVYKELENIAYPENQYSNVQITIPESKLTFKQHIALKKIIADKGWIVKPPYPDEPQAPEGYYRFIIRHPGIYITPKLPIKTNKSSVKLRSTGHFLIFTGAVAGLISSPIISSFPLLIVSLLIITGLVIAVFGDFK